MSTPGQSCPRSAFSIIATPPCPLVVLLLTTGPALLPLLPSPPNISPHLATLPAPQHGLGSPHTIEHFPLVVVCLQAGQPGFKVPCAPGPTCTVSCLSQWSPFGEIREIPQKLPRVNGEPPRAGSFKADPLSHPSSCLLLAHR